MTNVRNLALPQLRQLAERPENRCVVPLTEFCEFTPGKHDLGDGKPPLKGEMWFSVIDREWPALRDAFERWLDPANFDTEGRQRQSLASFRSPAA